MRLLAWRGVSPESLAAQQPAIWAGRRTSRDQPPARSARSPQALPQSRRSPDGECRAEPIRGVGAEVDDDSHDGRRERAGQRRDGVADSKDRSALPDRRDLRDQDRSEHEDHVTERKCEDRARDRRERSRGLWTAARPSTALSAKLMSMNRNSKPTAIQARVTPALGPTSVVRVLTSFMGARCPSLPGGSPDIGVTSMSPRHDRALPVPAKRGRRVSARQCRIARFYLDR